MKFDEYELFKKILSKWDLKGREVDLTLRQIAALTLGAGTSENASTVGRCINLYSDYFSKKTKHKWKVNWQSVLDDHSEILGDAKTASKTEKPHPLKDAVKALEDEIQAVKKKTRQEPIHAETVHPIAESTPFPMYRVLLDRSAESGEDISIPDGVRVTLYWGKDAEVPSIPATLLSTDPIRESLIVECQQRIPGAQRDHSFRIFAEVEHLVRCIRDRVNEIRRAPSELAHILLQPGSDVIDHEWSSSISQGSLDDNQLDAVKFCLNRDLTFLWGPPGTGKTFTLSHLMVEAALAEKTVLGVSIANVAVDQIAHQVTKQLALRGPAGEELLESGQVLRFGHARLPEVTSDPRLFPRNEEIRRLRKTLHRLITRRQMLPHDDAEDRAKYQQEINQIRSRLREVTRRSIEEAKIVLTTGVQAAMERLLSERRYDLVVVDEASMMPAATSLCMAQVSRSKVVFGGDFQQLGPVAISRSARALEWLHQSVFERAGVTSRRGNPRVTMLTNQRRMEPEICDLINPHYYDGRLKSTPNDERARLKQLPPAQGQAATWVHCTPEMGSHVRRTARHSRYNKTTALIVARILNLLLDRLHQGDIGVITPYRAQIRRIRKEIADSHFTEEQKKRIRVGTVHAFQGAEADVVIWDLVDTRDETVGRLFRGKDGDRLVNVAISRVRGKLIVVGDRKAFAKARGSRSVRSFKNIIIHGFDADSIVPADSLS